MVIKIHSFIALTLNARYPVLNWRKESHLQGDLAGQES